MQTEIAVNSYEPEPISSAPAPRWYLVFTKPSAEETARAHLERQGYQVYFPRVAQKKLRRGRWEERIGALFPRYVFLQLDAARQSLAPIQSTVGVSDTVRFGAEYAVVPERIVGALIKRADPTTGLHQLTRPLFSPGMAVRVIAGAFEGLDGVFQRDLGADRIAVLFRLLGRDVSVRVPSGFVAPNYA